MKTRGRRGLAKVLLASFLVAMAVMVGICAWKKVVPFGDKSLAYVDATIQYLDFFSWGKDIANGDAGANYDLSKVLGGNTVAVFTYYLASPLSLLLPLFDKADLQLYFTLLIMLKVGLAAMSMTWFLWKRVEKLKNYQIIVLASSYALCGWMFYSIQNQMWIDAMIMYPLLCYEATRLVREGKGARLAIFTTVTLVVNWYAGLMAVMGTAIWWLYEILKAKKFSVRGALRYVGTILVGAIAAGAVLVPTMAGLAMGRGKVEIDLDTLLGYDRLYNPLNLLDGLFIGGETNSGFTDLYVGMVAAILVIWLILEHEKWRERRFEIGLIAGVLLIHLIPALVWLFDLGRFPGSFIYRYGFISVLPLIYVAGVRWAEGIDRRMVAKMVGGIALGFLVYEFIGGSLSGKEIWVNLLVMAGWGVVLGMGFSRSCSGGFLRGFLVDGERLRGVLAIGMVMIELGVSGILCAKIGSDGKSYGEYVRREEELIEKIERMDDGEYRVHNLATRGDGLQWETLTANYNEALAFNYNSVSGYTSSPDEAVGDFLDRIGYNRNGENMNITNDSLVVADAVLGVKYVLAGEAGSGGSASSTGASGSSSEVVSGDLSEYEKVFSDGVKTVYRNPYALPMAMGFAGESEFNCESENPFLCQNEMLSEILGEEVEVYREVDDITDASKGPVYLVASGKGEIYVDGKLKTKYGEWLAPEVVRVSGGAADAASASEGVAVSEGVSDLRFYEADLARLAEAREKILARAEMAEFVDNGDEFKVKMNVAEGVSKVLVTIPQDGNFRVLVNGAEVEAEKFMGALMVVPVGEGENEIVLKYETPGVMIGAAMSVVGIFGEVGMVVGERRRKD